MIQAVEDKWLQAREELLGEIGNISSVQCFIPDWEPTDLAMGLKWLQSSIYEGYVVGFEVSKSGDHAQVIFSISEQEWD